jgi:hypothetical protein
MDAAPNTAIEQASRSTGSPRDNPKCAVRSVQQSEADLVRWFLRRRCRSAEPRRIGFRLHTRRIRDERNRVVIAG